MDRSKKILLNAYCFFGSLGTALTVFLVATHAWTFVESPLFNLAFLVSGLAFMAGGIFFLLRYRSLPLSRAMWLIIFLGFALCLLSVGARIVFPSAF